MASRYVNSQASFFSEAWLFFLLIHGECLSETRSAARLSLDKASP
jgi:hypothetical protein